MHLGKIATSARSGEIVVTARCFAAVMVFVATLVVTLAAGGATPARAAGQHPITLTLVRHAQSAANASGVIDTSTPGPELSPRGWCQATLVAPQLAQNHYDGVYASSMIRTQETATPTSQALTESVTVLPGLREIEAGDYEGTPEADIAQTYFAAPHGGCGVTAPRASRARSTATSSTRDSAKPSNASMTPASRTRSRFHTARRSCSGS